MRATTMRLSDKALKVEKSGNLSKLTSEKRAAGNLLPAPVSCAFLIL